MTDPFARRKTYVLAVVVDEDVEITGEFIAAAGVLAKAEVRRRFDPLQVHDCMVRTRDVPGGQVVRAEVIYAPRPDPN